MRRFFEQDNYQVVGRIAAACHRHVCTEFLKRSNMLSHSILPPSSVSSTSSLPPASAAVLRLLVDYMSLCVLEPEYSLRNFRQGHLGT